GVERRLASRVARAPGGDACCGRAIGSLEGLANLGLQRLGVFVLNAHDQQVQSLTSFRPTAIDRKAKPGVGVLFQVRKSDFDLVALVSIQDQGSLEASLPRIVARLVKDGGKLLKTVDIDADHLGFL